MLKVIIVILKRRKYFIIAAVTSLVVFSLFYYLTVVNVYKKSIIIYAEMNGDWFTVISLFLSLLISLLFGIYLSLSVFRFSIAKAKALGNKTLAGLGSAAGVIAAGCPGCGVPILGLISSPLALLSLPFEGLEIKALSVILLCLSVYLIAKNIKQNLYCDRKSK